MFINIDHEKRPSDYKLHLAKPNKEIISVLHEKQNSTLNLKLGNISELNFSIPYFVEDSNLQMIKNPNIERIRELMYVKLTWGEFEEWFLIDNITESSEDNEIMNIQAFSIGYENKRKKINEFKETAINATEFYTEILKDSPWSIGEIDGSFDLLYRSFDESGTDRFELIKTGAETFGGVIVWDTNNKKINLKEPDNIGEFRGLTVSYDRLMSSLNKTRTTDEMVTRLYVYGNERITIENKNPTNEKYIEDYSYFMHPFKRDANKNVLESSYYMSDSLCHALLDNKELRDEYEPQIKTIQGNIENKNASLSLAMIELNDAEFTLMSAKGLLDIAKAVDDKALIAQRKTEVSNATSIVNTKKIAVNNLTSQIEGLQNQVSVLQNAISVRSFTKELIDELEPYIIEKEIEDARYIDEDELYEFAKEKFSEIREPRVVIETGIEGLMNSVEEQYYWDKLNLGDTMRVRQKRMNIDYKSRIIEMNIGLDDSDVEVKIANFTENVDNLDKFISILYSSESNSTVLNNNKHKWDSVVEIRDEVTQLRESEIDATKKRITAGVNESVEIGDRGVVITTPSFPNEMIIMQAGVIALSEDGGETWKTSITPKGVIADTIIGKLVASNNLIVTNDSGSMILDGTGLTVDADSIKIMSGGSNPKNIIEDWNSMIIDMDNFANDNVLTPYEKSQISHQWNMISDAHTKLIESFIDNMGNETAENPYPLEYDIYLETYERLRNFLFSDKQSDGYSMLNSSRMQFVSPVSSESYRSTLTNYMTAKDDFILVIPMEYTNSSIRVLEEGIFLEYVKSDELVASLNLSEEGVRIDGKLLSINSETSFRNDVVMDAGVIKSADNAIKIDLNAGTIDLSRPLTINAVPVATKEDIENIEMTYTPVLSNDTANIPTDENGNGGNYYTANTEITIYQQSKDDTINWTITADESTGVTGSLSGNKYTVTGMTTNVGYVDLIAKKSEKTLVKRFTLAKTKDGQSGIVPPMLSLSSTGQIMTFDSGNNPTPSSQEIQVVARVNNYEGQVSWKIEKFNGNSLVETTTPSKNSQNTIMINQSVMTGNITSVRVTAYDLDANSNFSDYLTIYKLKESMDGVGIESITEYYLATSQATDVTNSTSGFTTTIQTITDVNRYLWNYEKIKYTDGTDKSTVPVIIGVHGQKGDIGEDGRSITSITEHYLATSLESDVSRETSGWTTTMQQTDDNKRYLWNYETISWNKAPLTTYVAPVIIGVHGKKGDSGENAKLLFLTSTLESMIFNSDGSPNPTSQIATIEAKLQNVTGTVTFSAKAYNGTTELADSITLSGTGNSRTFSVANFPNNASHITVTATIGNLTDNISIFKLRHGQKGDEGDKGLDAYTVVLSNESHAFVGDVSNALAGTTSFNVIAYKGSTRVSSTIGNISGLPTGMNATLSNNGTTTSGVNISVTTKMVSPNGTLTIPITVDGKVFTKNFSYSIAFKGAKGDIGQTGQAGKGISSTVIDYKNHTSGTATPSGSWNTEIPTPIKGQYLWTRTRTTYTDNSVVPTYSVAYNATDGQNGSDGKGISSTDVAYQLSSDGITAPTGSWLSNPPTPVKGQYLWTRTVISYTSGNPSTSYSTSYFATDGQKGDKGDTGENAKVVIVTPSAQIFARDENNVITPSTITINGSTQNTTISTWQYSVDGGNFGTTLPAGVKRSGNVVTITGSTMTARTIAVKALDSSGNADTTTIAKVQDGATGQDGSKGDNAIVGYLTNESITLGADSSGVVASFASATGTFKMFDGVTDVTGSDSTVFSLNSVSGLTASINSSTGVYTVTAMSADTATAEFKAVYKNITITKTLSLSKSRVGATGGDGAKGADGKGISSAVVTYQNHTNGTTAPTGTWNNSPSPVKGQYLWTRTVTTYTEGNPITTYAVAYNALDGQRGEAGATGGKGTDGTGISSTVIRYFQSTSGTTTPTGDGSTTPPTPIQGQYNWTRTVITYTNGTNSTAWSTSYNAKDGLKGDKGDTGSQGVSPIVGLLTNESITLPASDLGAVPSFSGATGTFNVYEGTVLKNASATYSVPSQSGITVSITQSGVYTVTAMTTGTSVLSGTATLRAVHGGVTVDKILTVTKALAGTQGATGATGGTGATGSAGQNATSYWINASVNAIKKDVVGNIVPNTITFSGFSKTGTANPVAYAGRFIIQTSTDGTSYETAYTSTANQSSYTYTIPATASFVKARYYLANGTTILLDEQTIPVLIDAEGIEIGGRNLIKKSDFGNIVWSGVSGSAVLDEDYPNGLKATGGNNGGNNYIEFPNVLDGNGWYTVSLLARGTQNGTRGLSVIIGDSSAITDGRIGNSANEYTYHTYSYKVENYNAETNNSIKIAGLDYAYYRIDNIKLEKGNIATDWTEAPEDVQEQIGKKADIEAVDNLKNETIPALKDGLLNSSEKEVVRQSLNVVSADKKGIDTQFTTVHGNTALTGASKTNLNSAKDVLNTAFTNLQSAINAVLGVGDGTRIATNQMTLVTTRLNEYGTALSTYNQRYEQAQDAISSEKKRLGDVYALAQATLAETQAKAHADGKITAEENRAIADAKAKLDEAKKYVDALEVGGRNLWLNHLTTDYSAIESLGANHITGQTECFRLDNGARLNFNIEPDYSSRLYRKITMSAWVKYTNVVQGSNGWNKFNIFKHSMVRKNSASGATTSTDYATLGGFTGTSDWKKVVYTYDYSGNTSYDQLKTQLFFNLEGTVSGTAWITGIKVEYGNKATDWTPAPEDVQERIGNKADIEVIDNLKNELQDYTKQEDYLNSIGEVNSSLETYKSLLEIIERDLKGERDENGEFVLDVNGNPINVGAIKEIEDIVNRESAIVNNLGELSERWNFIGTNIIMASEGLLIGETEINAEGKETLVTGIRISKNRVDFVENKTIIAEITGSRMKINRAIFVQSISVGEHKIETLSGGHTIWSWVPTI